MSSFLFPAGDFRKKFTHRLDGSWFADAFFIYSLFFQAVSDYRKALDLDEDFQRAKEGMQTAQKRQKQASKRDYYKILGVKRNAGKKEINKAYRWERR